MKTRTVKGLSKGLVKQALPGAAGTETEVGRWCPCSAQGFSRSPQRAAFHKLPAESKRSGNPLPSACRLQYPKGPFSQVLVSPVHGWGGRGGKSSNRGRCGSRARDLGVISTTLLPTELTDRPTGGGAAGASKRAPSALLPSSESSRSPRRRLPVASRQLRALR